MPNKSLKDHRQIGQEQELFFTDEIAPGAPFWLPKGMVIFKELEKYIRELTEKAGYQETSTPVMVKSDLFKQSGHWEKFGQGGGNDMYNLSLWEPHEITDIYSVVTQKVRSLFNSRGKDALTNPLNIDIRFKNEDLSIRIEEVRVEGINIFLNGISLPVNYTLKPMNCPESTVLYRFRPRSYKEMPLRYSEIGRLHRREKAGEIGGLLRVRQLTMDDAHIYATEDQIFDEVSDILDMMIAFYKSFGFEYEFRLATRPELRAGSDANWDKAEKELAEALKKKNLSAGDKLGDGAFYGPKIDVHIKDSQGREWQLATVQLDFHMPEAFKLEYINERGDKQKPVMIHRAIFGSFERFIAILTEHYQGAFPVWLSPVQAVIIPITERNNNFAASMIRIIRAGNIRIELDDRPETMQSKIRDAQIQKIPYMLIVGDREEKENRVTVRTRGEENLGAMDINKFLDKIKEEIENKQ